MVILIVIQVAIDFLFCIIPSIVSAENFPCHCAMNNFAVVSHRSGRPAGQATQAERLVGRRAERFDILTPLEYSAPKTLNSWQ